MDFDGNAAVTMAMRAGRPPGSADRALWILMFVGLYNWSRYAPIFSPGAAGSPIEEAMPWSQ